MVFESLCDVKKTKKGDQEGLEFYLKEILEKSKRSAFGDGSQVSRSSQKLKKSLSFSLSFFLSLSLSLSLFLSFFLSLSLSLSLSLPLSLSLSLFPLPLTCTRRNFKRLLIPLHLLRRRPCRPRRLPPCFRRLLDHPCCRYRL